MDLMKVIKRKLEEDGVKNVYTHLPNGREHPDHVMLTYSIPERKIVDYSGMESAPYRVTAIITNRSINGASDTAQAVYETLRYASLESDDGSYDLESVDVTDPRPLPWDESGRYQYAIDAYIETRKDLFNG